MSEIAKCPRCGETPKRIQYKAGGFGHICCGAEFFCTTYWNQYAAAMEFARIEYALEHCEPKHEHQYQFHLEEARMRVLEVFNEQATEVDKSKNIMVYLNGKGKPAFRCHCGCNVFYHPTDMPEEKSQQTYICNACDTQYIGE